MGLLRIIGYFALSLLSAIFLWGLYYSLSKGRWEHFGMWFTMLVIVALLGYGLRLTGGKPDNSSVIPRSRRTVIGLFLAAIAISSGIRSVERGMSGSWFFAGEFLVLAVVLLVGAGYAFLKRSNPPTQQDNKR